MRMRVEDGACVGTFKVVVVKWLGLGCMPWRLVLGCSGWLLL